MRSLPFLLLLAGLSPLVPRAHAQTSFSIGPRVGLNLTTYYIGEQVPVGGPVGTPQYRTGLEAGVASILSRGHFAVQGALLYAQRGYQEHTDVEVRASNGVARTADLEYAERLHYLTLPLALAYTPRRDGQGLQVFAGPYISLLLGGRYTNTTTPQGGSPIAESGAITAAPDAAYDYGHFVRRYDAGLQGGLGYRYQGLLLQAGYSLGLRNLLAETSSPSRAAQYNRAFQVSLSYLLTPKH